MYRKQERLRLYKYVEYHLPEYLAALLAEREDVTSEEFAEWLEDVTSVAIRTTTLRRHIARYVESSANRYIEARGDRYGLTQHARHSAVPAREAALGILARRRTSTRQRPTVKAR